MSTQTSPVDTTNPITASTRTLRRRLANEDLWTRATAPVALVVLTVTFTIVNPKFLTWPSLTSMLADSTIPIVLALGATFAVTLAGIDLSLASTVALGSVTMGLAYQAGLPLWLCCLVAMATGLSVGALNGVIIGWVRIPDFIVTLGSMSLVMGLSLIFSQGKPVQIPERALTFVSITSVGGIRFNFLIALAIGVLLHIVLFHTRFGTHLLAVGDNPDAARAMGLKVARVKLAGYVICGLMGGVGAVLLTSYIGSSQPATNTDYLLKAIAAVVLGGVSLFGGRATIIGPILGAILLTFLQSGLTLVGVSAFYSPLVIGIVVIAAAMLMRGRK
ncbi:MAG: ABC transporter permease [Microbacterium sp.]|jgi:ribose/xylose/arabinose/galactoside ABC-type transport system permease subunit|uniref:Autoinducer 2 import system permease protein LsrD n=1 Tax=Microbacterium ginsengisoli TaxID=400772 RepID=A0A0F0LUD6_9MICO|nr:MULTISPECIES: ABC transporter permease [Microbacterium]MAL06000.1 ABC transporter permease [Microbacterium sp.]MCK9917045.1 ABC transporter permease [Microbacteriaceae bacterium K1510]KJL36718.1 Ribose transport system permease protein RbsC [Microbacterium ginsengisoli]MBN9207435.1 ABC transporter permease [Microbacterium ginsengisoli]HAN23202.1 ABC transporter permease [Microbacterium ginsengisoli]